MRKLLLPFLFLLASLGAEGATNPHPRLLGFYGVQLGAADGTTVGSLRYQAVQNSTNWSTACGIVDSWYVTYIGGGTLFSTFRPSLQSQWAYAATAGLLYQTLTGFTGSQSACQHTAAQYGSLGLQIGQSIQEWLNGINTASYTSGGTAPTSGSCTVSSFNDGSSGTTATITLPLSAGKLITITNPGTGSSSAATSAVLSGAGCSGTIVVSTTSASYGRCGGPNVCNATTRPPYYSGNDFRGGGGLVWMASAFDFLFPLLGSSDITSWVTTMEQSAEVVMLPSCPLTCTYMQNYGGFGVGPSNNGYTGYWGPIGIMGAAIIGSEIISHPTTSCPTVTGAGTPSACNDLLGNFLQIVQNNIAPWWTTQTSQLNSYPTPNICGAPQAITTSAPLSYAGGAGCMGPGGFGNDGFEYGVQTNFQLLNAIDQISSADTALNLWNAFPSTFAAQQARALLHMTSPQTSTLYGGTTPSYEIEHFGDEQTPFHPTAYTQHGSSLILAAALGSSSLGSAMRYYYTNTYPYQQDFPNDNNNKPYEYLELLWRDGSGLPVTSWTTSPQSEPLDWFSMGENWMISLSDYTTSATWVSFLGNEMINNHQQADSGELQIYTNGQWVLLHPPGYSNQWTGPGTHNNLSYQGPNEVNSAIWKGVQPVAFNNGQPSVIANEIDPSGRFVHVWYNTTGGFDSTHIATCKSSSAQYTQGGSGGDDDYFAYAGSSQCPASGQSYHYQLVIDGQNVASCSGSSDTFKYRISLNQGAFGAYVTGNCIPGACTTSSCTQKFSLPGGGTAQWTHATGHNLGSQWDVRTDNWVDFLEVNNMEREFVYIKPNGAGHGQYVVELGRGQFRNSTDLMRSEWSFPYSTPPTLSGNVIASQNNGSYIWLTPAYSLNGFTSALQDFATLPGMFFEKEYWLNGELEGLNSGVGGAGALDYGPTCPVVVCGSTPADIAAYSISNRSGVLFYKGTVTANSGSSSQVMANVLQIANNSLTPSPVENFLSGGLLLIHIKDSSQDQVVGLSQAAGGSLLTLPSSPLAFTWTRVSSSTQILLFDLPASTPVYVLASQSGSLTTLQLASSSCSTCGAFTSLTTSTQGSLALQDAAGALSVVTTSLPPGVQGLAVSQTFQATGGTPPYTWTETGTLQSGLSFSSSGVLSGTPTSSGSVTPSWKATDSLGATSANSVPFLVSPAVSITTSSLPGGTQGVAYSQLVGVSGGNLPYVCSLSAGSLPPGLGPLQAQGGGCLIAGTPTGGGTNSFTLLACDSTVSSNSGPSCASQNLSITVTSPGPPITFTAPCTPTCSTSSGVIGTPLTITFAASGGTGAPFSWSQVSGTLPPGLTFQGACGTAILCGTPSSSGTFSYGIQVTDGTTITSGTFTTQVTSSISISPLSVGGGSLGVPYSPVTFSAFGGVAPYSWNVIVNSPPPGLALGGTGGNILSGTPTQSGTYPFTLQVTDSNGLTANQNYSISVSGGNLVQMGAAKNVGVQVQ